ncbi:alpha-amylase family glycosyl hydrolase [Accumulibacter sp.]|uniref:alpha-amylase C-terminal beta-sheet domain-containing protein n=1 Tax=Accumulibacter sp. TaxID=2053492 RepID=UPI00260215FA|nr:alpha-amylase family glycosyl hydrolase [Accumulibacter sp.]
MLNNRFIRMIALVCAIALCGSAPAAAQSGFEDDRVMLQGFYWESYRHGYPDKFPTFGKQKWYEIVRQLAPVIRDGRFDLIWLPPPSYAGGESAGYNPKEYFRLDNSYGSFNQHEAMLKALLESGVEPVADIVINHRDGVGGWADFKNPDWGTWAICRTDEAFQDAPSGLTNTPDSEKGDCEERPDYVTHSGTTYQYESFRDIAHVDLRVRRDIVRYLRQLQSLGYRGWRYDMVHGYLAKWIALYNDKTKPTFSVGEYDWARHEDQRGWIWNTATNAAATGAEHLKTSSDVFDFSTQFALKEFRGWNYGALYGSGDGIGMVGDTTDNLPWKNRAVTFLENHDTGYRTNPDGTPEKGHESDNFANNWQVEQGYAHILTHPGVPSVYWKHYFDWGSDLQNKIKALVNARKVAGVHAASDLQLQQNARANGVYAARIDGHNGELYVRIGGSDREWQPSMSNYTDYREYAQGAGWKVWVKLAGNPAFREAGRNESLPVPKYKPPKQIGVSDVQ